PTVTTPEEWFRAMIYDLPIPIPTDEQVFAFTLWKEPQWSFEKEWRLCWKTEPGTPGTHADYKYPCRSLVELRLGAETGSSVAVAIAELARQVNPRVQIPGASVATFKRRLSGREEG